MNRCSICDQEFDSHSKKAIRVSDERFQQSKDNVVNEVMQAIKGDSSLVKIY